MERIDVAVVGGGPAGASAGRTAAAGGANVVVFEKGVPREDRPGAGPDSTDAAGLLDYWLDLMDVDPDEIPEEVVLRQLDGATFHGPEHSLDIDRTGMSGSYPAFGMAVHRAKFDDWLREESEAAGATYRVGDSVKSVETDLSGDADRSQFHTVTLSTGEQFEAEYLVLADGPQRTVTIDALDQFTPPDRSIADILDPTAVNHIAYQEHRRVPEDLAASSRLQFWWGLMPGHTAYPWLFPNDGDVARIGLTMPIGLDIDDYDPDDWALLRADDDQIPRGGEYIERLLEYAFPEYDLADFPLVEDRGKRAGTETYPISSTRPVESPTAAGIAVVGGAMGGTSAFHEGGDHVAVRTGKLAGRLAAADDLERYNDAWQDALSSELRRNVTAADMVADYGPDEWDRAFRVAAPLVNSTGYSLSTLLQAGIPGMRLLWEYRRTKRQYTNGGYVQFAESEYTV